MAIKLTADVVEAQGVNYGVNYNIDKEIDLSNFKWAIRPINSKDGIKAASYGIALVNSKKLSYSQPLRMQLSKQLSNCGWNIETYITSGETAHCDCSSFCSAIYGLIYAEIRNSALSSTTATIASNFVATKLFTITTDLTNYQPCAGDILVRRTAVSGHAIMITEGTSAESFGVTGMGVYVDNGVLWLPDSVEYLSSSNSYQFLDLQKEQNDSATEQSKTASSKLKQALTKLKNNSFIDDTSEIPSQILSDSSAILIYAENTNKRTAKNISQTGTKGTLIIDDNLVQAPFIILDFNGVTIGGYNNQGDKYPNYIDSLVVKKYNGKINQYTINLKYTVRSNEDPNLIDKLLSRTGVNNKLKIKYGDSMSSSYYFEDNEVVITGATFSEDISSHTISYTIEATSSIISIYNCTYNFAGCTAKPSTKIFELLYENKYTSALLLNQFPGMKNKSLVMSSGLIPTDDTPVKFSTMLDISPIKALEYYVSGMYNSFGNTYTISYFDNTNNEFNGAYFKINKISNKNTNTLSGNYFEIDVGYPTNDCILDFNITTSTYFPLVYNYNGQFDKWDYTIDDTGNLISTKTNSLISNNTKHLKNVVQSNWWTQVTEYPISATLKLKGLSKAIGLMSYIKINVLFYGNSDLASGLYVVTGQEDSISSSGCVTTLTLLRVGN